MLAEQRYFFDKQPFEADIYSHMFSAIAAANAEAGRVSGNDRTAVRKAVNEAIDEQLAIVVPNMALADRNSIATRFPDALRHPRFGPAWCLVRESAADWSPVMAVPGDVAVAIVLAGLGIPTAPLLASPPVCAAPPTTDVDHLIDLFAGDRRLLVGFEPAALDFYFLVSASAHSLRRCLRSDPRFRELRRAFGKMLDRPSSGPMGVWGAYPKKPGQRLSTVGHSDGGPEGLTTIFIGGWMENGIARDHGGPTIQPIPLRVVEYMMRHGVIAMNGVLKRAKPG